MTCNPSYPSMNDFGYFQHQYQPLTPDYIPNTQSISYTQSQYDTAANEWMKFLHGHSIYQNHHQRTSRCQDAPQAQEKRQVSLCLSKQGHGNQRPRLVRAPSSGLETSLGLGLSHEISEPIESHDYDYSPQIPSRRTSTRSLSISSSSSSTSKSSWSSWSSWSSESDMEAEYGTHCQNKLYHRKNKVLPPPTLPPILVPTTPQPTTSAAAAAFYSVGAVSCDQLSVSSLIDDESSISSYGSDSDDESLNGSSWLAFDTNRSRESSQDYYDHCSQSDNDGLTSTHSNKYLAMSASIWGPGWHQVDPLPPSFTKAMLQNELDAQEKAQAEAQERAAQATSSKAKAKRARQQAKLAAAAAAAAATADTSVVSEEVSNTVDSSIENTSRLKAPVIASSAKLPRSLQFVD